MTKGDDPDAWKTGRGFVVERVFDAPRGLVFEAWTEPERLKRWWGPRGYTVPHCEIDLREGGVFHFCMRSPEGRDSWGRACSGRSSRPSGSCSPWPSRTPRATWSRPRTMGLERVMNSIRNALGMRE